MVSYPLTTTFVQPGETLGLVVRVLQRPDDQSVAHVAAANDCSPAHLYDLLARCREALQPRRPGPDPRAGKLLRLEARVAEFEADRARDRARIAELQGQLRGAVRLDPQRLARLEVVMAANNVPLRGMREILTVAFGARSAPSLGTLQAHVAAHGCKARKLLDRARAQVCPRLLCVACDDVFLQGDAVKVITEPRSNAVLQARRWPWHKGEDWALMLQEFTALLLLACDLGSDLTAAVDDTDPGRRIERKARRSGAPGAEPVRVAHLLRQIIDYWHEMDWWEDEMFKPLDRLHEALRKEIAEGTAKLAGLHGADRVEARRVLACVVRRRATVEREYYVACEAQEQVRVLYQPLRPDGMPWTEADVVAAIDGVRTTLRRIVHEVGWSAREHVERHAHRYGTHRVLMDAIEVKLRPGSPWTRRDVFGALSQERELRRRSNDMRLPVEAMMAADRQARRLVSALRRHCANLAAVRASWEDLVDWPRRSSSGTESFNNRLRVLQVVQRYVSDERIALHALEHNLAPREDGRRRGQSPYQILGIDFAKTDKPWYDVLLEAA